MGSHIVCYLLNYGSVLSTVVGHIVCAQLMMAISVSVYVYNFVSHLNAKGIQNWGKVSLGRIDNSTV